MRERRAYKMQKRAMQLLAAVVLMTACGNSRTSQAVLEQKIDSIKKLELKRQMKLDGIDIDDVSPFRLFYDSLNMQALPLEYSEDYVRSLPGFKFVPEAIVKYLELEGREAPKAIALPETLGSRLVLLAADREDREYELWLYSLDSDCYPVDKLLVYEPLQFLGRRLRKDDREPYFSITSDYEVNVQEYANEYDEWGQMSTYIIDDSRMFIEKAPVLKSLIP